MPSFTLPTICWMYYYRLQINWVFQKKVCIHVPPFMLHSLPMLLSVTWSFCLYLAKSASCGGLPSSIMQFSVWIKHDMILTLGMLYPWSVVFLVTRLGPATGVTWYILCTSMRTASMYGSLWHKCACMCSVYTTVVCTAACVQCTLQLYVQQPVTQVCMHVFSVHYSCWGYRNTSVSWQKIAEVSEEFSAVIFRNEG
jgi:hypothetical protein